jgi:hypothetical protein
MRAAKGIFRTVDEPLGQLDARPSKIYRISWFGVCDLARSQNVTPQAPSEFGHTVDQSLLVRWKNPDLVSTGVCVFFCEFG